MKLVDYKLKKVQITCPNCKHEFTYNKIGLENKIKKMGIEIHNIGMTINGIKKMPEEKINKSEIKRLEKQRRNMEKLLSDYKLIRETLKENEDKVVFENLKNAIRQIGGEELYKLCMDTALRDSKAYNIDEMMCVKNNVHNDGGSLQKITK